MNIKRLIVLMSIFFCVVHVASVQDVESCEDDTFIILRDGTAISIQAPDAPRNLIEPIRLLEPYAMDYSPVTQTLAMIAEDGLYLFRAADSQPQPVLDTAEESRSFHSLAWSPDGQQIIFGVYELGDSQDFTDGRISLSVYNAGRETLESVLDLFPDMAEVGGVLDLSWSPDDSFIAVTTITQPQEETTRLLSTACLSDEPGSCQLEDILMRNSGDEPRYAPSWSPDSYSLGFICGNELCIYDVEQVHVERLVEFQMKNILFWMPCGQRIIYQDLDNNLMLRALESDTETLITTISYGSLRTILSLPEADFLFEE